MGGEERMDYIQSVQRQLSGENGTEDYRRYYGERQVQDAIIKPDGSIIRTSPDDTIVATKNNAQTITQDNSIFLQEMINILRLLLRETTAIKNKPTQSGRMSNGQLELMSRGDIY
jgi:hypothetical protein